MCWSRKRALRLHTIKCCMANAFLIRPGGLGCRLKRKGPGAQETEREREWGRENREEKERELLWLWSPSSLRFCLFTQSLFHFLATLLVKIWRNITFTLFKSAMAIFFYHLRAAETSCEHKTDILRHITGCRATLAFVLSRVSGHLANVSSIFTLF